MIVHVLIFLLCQQEALKKKQQPPVSAPSPSSNVSSSPNLNSLMETATAQPTVPCLTPNSPAATQETSLTEVSI